MKKPKVHVKLDKLEKLMKDMNRNVSIKVGILSPEAQQNHKETNLTNVELGTIHEFGATINVTDKMRNYLASRGIHLRKDTTQIKIPPRSFLRDSLLTSEGKKELINVINSQAGEINLNELSKNTADGILDDIVHMLAETALMEVQRAFETNGYGKWEPISEITKQMRKENKSDSALVDSGDLKKSISYSINGVQWAKPPYKNK